MNIVIKLYQKFPSERFLDGDGPTKQQVFEDFAKELPKVMEKLPLERPSWLRHWEITSIEVL